MSSVGDVGTDLHAGFAVALLRAMAPDADENVVVSPWSVPSALAVLAPGVEVRARQEIEQALAAGTSTDDAVAELAAGAAKVARHHAVPGDDSVLAVANTLWVDDSRTPVAHFLQQLERWPGAALRFAPMIADPDGVRAAINAGVARTTRGLIKEILPEGSVTSDDRAVIANALYLLAGWIDRFDAARTSDEPFDAPSGQRDVPTMCGGREAAYAHDAWEYLALPLWRDLQAEILLPPAGTAAENVVQALDGTVLVELRRQATDHRVDVHLPRFRVESGTL